jgi:hypothetical protein
MAMIAADRYVWSEDLLIPCQERVLIGGPGVIRGACMVGRTATTSMGKPTCLSSGKTGQLLAVYRNQ